MEPKEEQEAARQVLPAAKSGVEKKGAEQKKKKTPLWCCKECGWYLYVPHPCPLCTGASSVPSDLTALERVPPWRPSYGDQALEAVITEPQKTHVEDEKEVESSEEEDDSSDESESDEGEKEYRAELAEVDSEDDELASMMGGGGGGGWQLALKAATLPKREVKVWNVGTVGQRKKHAIPPKPEGATRFVCISDTHNRHRMLELPAGDVLLHSGDFSLSCKEKELVDFTEWLHEQPYAHKVVVAGNHDVLLHSEFYERHHWRYHTEKIERHLELKQRLRSVCTYLEDQLCEINGIKIWGSPWVPYYHDWAFMPPDDAGLKAAWAKVPTGVDVLITHGPPYKVRDKTYQGANAGCPLLADAVFKRIKPAVHCFGHIHTGYGVAKPRDSTFINAAIVNSGYKVANNAVMFDIQ